MLTESLDLFFGQRSHFSIDNYVLYAWVLLFFERFNIVTELQSIHMN